MQHDPVQLLQRLSNELGPEITDASNQGDRQGAALLQRFRNALERLSNRLILEDAADGPQED